MAGAKQLRHLIYPGSGRGRTSSSGVLGALYCLHRDARRGVATSEAGEEAWPPSPRGSIEVSANFVGKAESI
jgi:hypothetical protein